MKRTKGAKLQSQTVENRFEIFEINQTHINHNTSMSFYATIFNLFFRFQIHSGYHSLLCYAYFDFKFCLF
jgi:hypothetical protein